MASRNLKVKAFLTINGEKKLWYEIDREGNVTWYLPKKITEVHKKRMLDNIGEHMSRYIQNHPESALWGATN